MDLDFSKRSRDAILHAHKEAIRSKSLEITVEHLFLGIIKTDDPTRKILLNLNVDIDEVVKNLSQARPEKKKIRQANLSLSKSTEKMVKIAPFEAKLLRQKLTEPYHLLLAILRDPSNDVYLQFEKKGLVEKIKQEIKDGTESGRLRSGWFFPKWF